jgi:hypothetical protein
VNDERYDLDAELHEQEPEDIEAYCVRCRETITLENPVAVWTRKGVPATRGDCPTCGNPVFRMGRTRAHEAKSRPAPVNVGETRRAKLPKQTIYLNYAPADEQMAGQVAADLEKMGFATWQHQVAPEAVDWAGGVHPSLKECAQMVLLLSPDALNESTVETAWRFFRDKHKPVMVAVVAHTEPPDLLRRRPRFDLVADYKSAFRQLLSALNE